MSDQWTSRLSAYLDDELTQSERAELERHLETCQECQAAVAQLRRVVSWAQDYPGSSPDRDVWLRIAANIRGAAPGVVDLPSRSRGLRGTRYRVPQTLAAGIVLALVGSGSWWLARATAPQDRIAAVMDAPTPEASSTIALTVHAAQKYRPAIAELERVLFEEHGRLDSTTVRVLRAKLAIIDRALGEAQEALARDPYSGYLADHYTGMMKRKLKVLRAAAREAAVRS
jgi:anti-sigma factor RsiW